MRLLLIVSMLFSVTLSNAQSATKLLNTAYALKSAPKLKSFLDLWAKKSALIFNKSSTSKNDTFKALNELYNEFFLSVHQSDYLEVSQHGNTAAPNPVYLLINDNITYAVADSLPLLNEENIGFTELSQLMEISEGNIQSHKQIQPFQPQLNLSNCKILSLSKSYKKIIEDFLMSTPLSKSAAKRGYFENGHDEKKVKFLSRYISMVKRHWGNYWDYLSYPDIKKITFDSLLKSAVISYELSGKQGIACYKKKEDHWELIESRILISQ